MIAWEVPAAVNFNGDGFFNVRTRATVLLVGNTADPYTPLEKSVAPDPLHYDLADNCPVLRACLANSATRVF